MITEMLAQLHADWKDFLPLVNTGAIGVVLAWFMLRDEPRKRSMEETIERGNRINLVIVLAISELSSGLKGQAAELLKEVDAAMAKRDKK